MRKVKTSITVKSSIRELKNTGIYGDILCSMRDIISNNPASIVEDIMVYLNGVLENMNLKALIFYLYLNDGNVCRAKIIRDSILTNIGVL